MAKKTGRFRPVEFQPDDAIRYYKQGLGRSEIAKLMGCTQGYVSRMLLEAGFPRISKSPNADARSNALKVIDFICNNGGTLKEAMAELKLKVCVMTVRNVAKEEGIDIYAYRYFNHQAGIWVVKQAGFRRETPKGQYLIPATCTACGTTTELKWRQLFKTAPPPCPNCGADTEVKHCPCCGAVV